MAFITIPGFEGAVYKPDLNPANERKHNCKDCFSCQMCSDDRCDVCINRHTCDKKK